MSAAPRHKREFEFQIAQSEVMRDMLTGILRKSHAFSPKNGSKRLPSRDLFAGLSSWQTHTVADDELQAPVLESRSSPSSRSSCPTIEQILQRITNEEDIRRDSLEKLAAWRAELQALSSNPSSKLISSGILGSAPDDSSSLQSTQDDPQISKLSDEFSDDLHNRSLETAEKNVFVGIGGDSSAKHPKSDLSSRAKDTEESSRAKTETAVHDVSDDVKEGSVSQEDRVAAPSSGGREISKGFSTGSKQFSPSLASSPSDRARGTPSQTQDGSVAVGERMIGAVVNALKHSPTPSETNQTVLSNKSSTRKKPTEDLVSLVETGKIKALTVTKLRRLLRSYDLKTTGKKSELVARLVSLVKSGP